MAFDDYPVDVRADYPERSSRGWAALTILLIKFLALIPHFFVLAFLGIAQIVVAFVAQFVVAVKGEYPAGMHEFVTGVLRWGTRVTAFVFSLTDRYPPFALRAIDDYPVDVVVERPVRSSRVYAVFTILVEVLFVAGLVWLAVYLVDHADGVASVTQSSGGGTSSSFNYNLQSWGGSGLLLRQIAALPHLIVLIFVGLAAFVLWIVVQWVILFVARFPRGMYDLVAGYVRWYARVNAYSLGLIDRYPPFSISPSVTTAGPGSRPAAPPPPPMTATWPAAPQPGAPQAPPPQPPEPAPPAQPEAPPRP
jgi:hypothetical protein